LSRPALLLIAFALTGATLYLWALELVVGAAVLAWTVRARQLSARKSL
jgi:hypothetical protein